MTETLIHAYTPLIFWTGLGLLLLRFVPKALPRLLGRMLYWVGVPVEILSLARRTDFSEGAGLALAVTVAALTTGLALAWIGWRVGNHLAQGNLSRETELAGFPKLQEFSCQGSFFLSAILGNTGFVGLAIAPLLVSDRALSLVVCYSVTQNVVGTYGLGVFLASYFGRDYPRDSTKGDYPRGSSKADRQESYWWMPIRDVLLAPSLWAFIIGFSTQTVELPAAIESGLRASVWFVIPAAFLLMGIRLGQIQGWQSFQSALLPALLKVIVLPGLVGIGTTLVGLPTTSRLALVLMSGMPTAFAGLILAEEYDLDRELIASSIVLTSVLLLLIIPLWLFLLG